MNNRRARAWTSGSVSAIQRSFGPTAWLDNVEPQRAKISSAPSSAFSAAIWAPARVSMPYRIAGRSGVPSPSVTSTHGPMPLTPTATTSTSPGAVSSPASSVNSRHQISASISTWPGAGRSTVCSRTAVRRMRPPGSTSTPLLLEVPMSTPRYPRRRMAAAWQKSISDTSSSGWSSRGFRGFSRWRDARATRAWPPAHRPGSGSWRPACRAARRSGAPPCVGTCPAGGRWPRPWRPRP